MGIDPEPKAIPQVEATPCLSAAARWGHSQDTFCHFLSLTFAPLHGNISQESSKSPLPGHRVGCGFSRDSWVGEATERPQSSR